jgi:hypothetical protein
MLVERSDPAALSGTTVFVFVSDRLYSGAELRRRLYGLKPVFMAGGSRYLSLEWAGVGELIVRCNRCNLAKDIIDKQESVMDGVAVKYIGFP